MATSVDSALASASPSQTASPHPSPDRDTLSSSGESSGDRHVHDSPLDSGSKSQSATQASAEDATKVSATDESSPTHEKNSQPPTSPHPATKSSDESVVKSKAVGNKVSTGEASGHFPESATLKTGNAKPVESVPKQPEQPPSQAKDHLTKAKASKKSSDGSTLKSAAPQKKSAKSGANSKASTSTSTNAQTSRSVSVVQASAPAMPAAGTIARAARDVRTVLAEQREQSQTLITKLNILFVANGALLTSLSVSRLMVIPSLFSVGEVVGFLVSFTLLVRAFLPRQVAVSPNLEDRKFLERYLALAPDEYELQMLVNLTETYNANKQRLDDITQTLKYAAYATWSVAFVILAHMIGIYFLR